MASESQQDPLNFDGKVVIVTGGARGVGAGITARFTHAGASVVICGRSEPGELAGGVSFVQADVRDVDDIERLVQTTLDMHGRLDTVVNNAGGSPNADSATASPRFSEAIIRLNLIAPLNLAQRANAVMQDHETGGTIINIASVSGTRPSPGTAAYGAAKAGLLNLTQTLAIDFAPKVRVNAVTAGLIETEQAELHYGDADGVERVAATVPLRRMGTPEDIADACLFLASPLSSYVNGTMILTLQMIS